MVVNSSTKKHAWLPWLIVFFAAILMAGVVFAQFLLPFFSTGDLQSSAGHINVLILGKGGKGHDGPDLTDTIILASVSLASPSATLISIPRDIWIPEIRAKVNSAYYWGNQDPNLGGGIPLAKIYIEKITGKKVDYAVVIDFSGFKDIVDAVGGIDVNVANSFTDNKYPIAGRESDLCGGDREFKCRYETIHFEKGLVHMNGETALKFVRSRNGDNGENTDFARELRQQKVITAIKNEVLSFHNWINPATDLKIWQAVKNATETDIDKEVLGSLALAFFKSRNHIVSATIPEDLLINPPISRQYDLQYVFIPKGGNWDAVHQWVNNLDGL